MANAYSGLANSARNLSNQIYGIGNSLGEANARAAVSEAYAQYTIETGDRKNAVKARSPELMQAMLDMYPAANPDSDETKATTKALFSGMAKSFQEGMNNPRGSADQFAEPNAPGTPSDQELGDNLDAKLQALSTGGEGNESLLMGSNTYGDFNQSKGPSPLSITVGDNMSAPAGEAADQLYAASDPEIQKYADQYVAIAQAQRDVALSKVRGRSARAALEQQINQEIANDYNEITNLGVEWKISDTKTEALQASGLEASSVQAGAEGLATTNAKIEEIISAIPYWTDSEKAKKIEAYQHEALLTWTGNGALESFDAASLVTEGEKAVSKTLGNGLEWKDYEVAEAEAYKWLEENSSGLSIKEVDGIRSNIARRTTDSVAAEQKRMVAHDEEIDQRMTDLFARETLTIDEVQNHEWYSYNRHLQWINRANSLDKPDGGIPRSEIRDDFMGKMAGAIIPAETEDEARELLWESEEVQRAIEENPQLRDDFVKYLGGNDIANYIGQDAPDKAIQTAVNTVVRNSGLPDSAQGLVLLDITSAIQAAKESNVNMTNDDVEAMANKMMAQYHHTSDAFFVDENGKQRTFSNKEVGGYGFTGDKDWKEESLYESFAIAIAEEEFASWIFFKNGKIDMNRVSNFLRAAGYDGAVSKNDVSLETILETFLRGPAEAVGSLGEGYKYKHPRTFSTGEGFGMLHIVENAQGQEEVYSVVVNPPGNTAYGDEARGTEIWVKHTLDENGAIVGSTYAGTVKTGAQLHAINAERENQIRSNASRYNLPYTNSEVTIINNLAKEIQKVQSPEGGNWIARTNRGIGRTADRVLNFFGVDADVPGASPEQYYSQTVQTARRMYDAGESDPTKWEPYKDLAPLTAGDLGQLDEDAVGE